MVAHAHDLLVGGRGALAPFVNPDVHQTDQGPQEHAQTQLVRGVALAADRTMKREANRGEMRQEGETAFRRGEQREITRRSFRWVAGSVPTVAAE